jgi:hypothetical protein
MQPNAPQNRGNLPTFRAGIDLIQNPPFLLCCEAAPGSSPELTTQW